MLIKHEVIIYRFTDAAWDAPSAKTKSLVCLNDSNIRILFVNAFLLVIQTADVFVSKNEKQAILETKAFPMYTQCSLVDLTRAS